MAKGLSCELAKFRELFGREIPSEMAKHVVGAEEFIWMVLLTLLAGSGHRDEGAPEYHAHILTEGGVGTGKTFIFSTIAKTVENSTYNRVQFTRDLKQLSLKRTVEQDEDGLIKYSPGPLSANFVLADEITRAGDAVHAALLEAMAEGVLVTPSKIYQTPRPYMVLATANPRDVTGVVGRLGTAFSDRFVFRIDAPEYTREQRVSIMLGQEERSKEKIRAVLSCEDILKARDLIHSEVSVDKTTVAVFIEQLTRLFADLFKDDQDSSRYGAEGERSALWFVRTAKARAFLFGRSYVILEDVTKLAYPILRHRISFGFEVPSSEKKSRIEAKISETLLA